MTRFISNKSDGSVLSLGSNIYLVHQILLCWCAENEEGRSEKCIICYSETSEENEITQVTDKSVLDRREGRVQISGNSQESNLSHVCLFRKSTGTSGSVFFIKEVKYSFSSDQ